MTICPGRRRGKIDIYMTDRAIATTKTTNCVRENRTWVAAEDEHLEAAAVWLALHLSPKQEQQRPVIVTS